MKAIFHLKDIHVIQGQKRNDIKVIIEQGADCIAIRPRGYGDSISPDGLGAPILLEVYEGNLRLLVWSDILIDDVTIIDMEGARETARKKEPRIVHSNSLPYFGDDGIVNIFDKATGKRVFAKKENFKDVTTEGGRAIQFYTYEIKKEET